jgi:hypothetical protein
MWSLTEGENRPSRENSFLSVYFLSIKFKVKCQVSQGTFSSESLQPRQNAWMNGLLAGTNNPTLLLTHVSFFDCCENCVNKLNLQPLVQWCKLGTCSSFCLSFIDPSMMQPWHEGSVKKKSHVCQMVSYTWAPIYRCYHSSHSVSEMFLRAALANAFKCASVQFWSCISLLKMSVSSLINEDCFWAWAFSRQLAVCDMWSNQREHFMGFEKYEHVSDFHKTLEKHFSLRNFLIQVFLSLFLFDLHHFNYKEWKTVTSAAAV